MSHNMPRIADKLRQNGYRVTPQRQLILDAVCQLGGHVTPEDVYEQVQPVAATLNRATVYRTLQFLSEQGILTVTQLRNGRFGYEIAQPEPHHHLVCTNCQTMIDVPHTAVAPFFKQMQAEHDFAIDMNHVSFFGLCEQCQDNN